jgi:hypothetical protein
VSSSVWAVATVTLRHAAINAITFVHISFSRQAIGG